MSPDIVDGKGLFAENRSYKYHLFSISSKIHDTQSDLLCFSKQMMDFIV